MHVCVYACVWAGGPLSSPELLDTRAARPFSFSFNTSDYRILHMDQDQGRLYLGSREYLVSLDMHNINKEPLIVRENPMMTPMIKFHRDRYIYYLIRFP